MIKANKNFSYISTGNSVYQKNIIIEDEKENIT